MSPKQSETVCLCSVCEICLCIFTTENIFTFWSPVYAYFKILSKDSASGQTNSCYHAKKKENELIMLMWPLSLVLRPKLHMSPCFWRRSEEDINVCMKPPLALLILLFEGKDEKKTKKHTGQQKAVCCLEHRNEHPCCQGSWETAAALSHYSALPQRRVGAGMELKHIQVTGAVTRARCAEGT